MAAWFVLSLTAGLAARSLVGCCSSADAYCVDCRTCVCLSSVGTAVGNVPRMNFNKSSKKREETHKEERKQGVLKEKLGHLFCPFYFIHNFFFCSSSLHSARRQSPFFSPSFSLAFSCSRSSFRFFPLCLVYPLSIFSFLLSLSSSLIVCYINNTE